MVPPIKKWLRRISLVSIFISGLLFRNFNSNADVYRYMSHKELRVQNLEDSNRKIILMAWTGFKETYASYLNHTAKTCTKCFFTEDKLYFNVSDAVVFHGERHPERPPSLPRPMNQIWVWYYLEPPVRFAETMRKQHKHYSNLFNWTMTYRKDSDIFLPYGRFFPFKMPTSYSSLEEKWSYIISEEKRNNGVYNRSLMPLPTTHDLEGRKMVAWIASRCNVDSKRDRLVNELVKFISVDIYGSCGKFKCPSRRSRLNHGIDCRTSIATKYKFYLAFENSICEDYVTEKFFRTLRTQMVPVVYGGADYSGMPKKSYISVMDFESVKDLADYLTYLDDNPLEYLKYFEWRNDFWVEQYNFVSQFCTLCDKLWALTGDAYESKSYPDIVKWWKFRSDSLESHEKRACESPNEHKIFSNM